MGLLRAYCCTNPSESCPDMGLLPFMAIRFDTPVLQTQRLLLRPIQASDVPTVQREFGRWAIIKNMSIKVPWPYPDDGAKFWYVQHVVPSYTNKNMAIWAIAKVEAPDMLIGVISIREDVGDGHRGFWLAESEWGQGYMTEAASAVNDWVFTHTPLEELIVYNVASNTASRRVKQKSGAEYIHTIIQDYHSGDCESEVWRIDKETWMNRNKT